MPPEILVIGSHAPGILIHSNRIPHPGETVIGWGYEEPVDGGKGSNQAIATARLGAKTAFIGCVGNDRIGKIGRDLITNAGVDCQFLIESDTMSSGIGFIILNHDGIPAMVTAMGANSEVDEKMFLDAVNYYGIPKVVLTQFEIKPEVACTVAKIAQNLGIVSIINPAPAVDLDLQNFASADILVPNESEAKYFLGINLDEKTNPIDLATELRRKSGCKNVLVTLGEDGMAGVNEDGGWRIIPPKVNVIDTSGAGDVFCAALAVGLINGLNIRESSYFATQASCLSVTRPGTIPAFPTDKEVTAFINEQNK